MWKDARHQREVPVDEPPSVPHQAKADTALATRDACLEQILEAFCDIADRDDIHQAAARLGLAQDWIKREAAKAAADPLFSPVDRAH